MEEAENLLSPLIDAAADATETEEALVTRGKVRWRLQNYGAAVSDFERAVALNPESEAVAALELARDIFNFYNPDLLNP